MPAFTALFSGASFVISLLIRDLLSSHFFFSFSLPTNSDPDPLSWRFSALPTTAARVFVFVVRIIKLFISSLPRVELCLLPLRSSRQVEPLEDTNLHTEI